MLKIRGVYFLYQRQISLEKQFYFFLTHFVFLDGIQTFPSFEVRQQLTRVELARQGFEM